MSKLNIDLKDRTKEAIEKSAKRAGKRTVKEYVLEKLGVQDIEKKRGE